jgi:hypothetical protein
MKGLVRDLGCPEQLEARRGRAPRRSSPGSTRAAAPVGGEELELVVDVERMHFFDLETGEGIDR